MDTRTFDLNRMPVKTWSWLKVNSISSDFYTIDATKGKPEITIKAPERIEIRREHGELSEELAYSSYFASEDMWQLMDENSNARYYIRVPEHHKEKDLIIITMELSGACEGLADDIVIDAGEGSESTILLNYKSTEGEKGFHNGRLRIRVQKGAALSLIKCQLLGSGVKHMDHLQAVVKREGDLRILQPEIGASEIVSGWNIVLEGEESNAQLDILYVGEGKKSLDFTGRMEIRAPKSNALIRARGVLTGKSRKVLRDTLDFVRGAAGSRGREEESVLMLSPDVRNISVPLLLCHEDDVEGEHAATSGRPDDQVLFYLMSRGLSEAAAQQLLAEASFATLLERLPDESLREEILLSLRKSIEGGGEVL